MLASRRLRRLAREGALPQRLLFASTGTKNPQASDVLCVRADLRMLARRLQVEAALAFTRSWDDLLATIANRSATLAAAS